MDLQWSVKPMESCSVTCKLVNVACCSAVSIDSLLDMIKYVFMLIVAHPPLCLPTSMETRSHNNHKPTQLLSTSV